MRTLDLIKALSEPEIKDVEKLLSGGKREILMKFFKELKKYTQKSEEPTHEELFKKIFDEPYAKDKDYLLRNRMRQLNEILYEYLATDAFKKAIEENPNDFNYWLARAYDDRKMGSLFESDIDSFLAEATAAYIKSHNKPSYSNNLYSLKSLWLMNNQPRIPENIENQLFLLEQWTKEAKRRFLYQIREIEARKEFVRHLQRNMLNLPEPAATKDDTIYTIDLQPMEQNDWFARHLTLKKKVYQVKGLEKIGVLEEMQQISAVPEYNAILGYSNQITNMINLGTEWIRLGEYQKGDNYLKDIMLLCKKAAEPIPIGAIQNYLANQFNLGKYDKGISIYKEYNTEISGSRSAHAITLQLCYLYLFAGKEDEAISRLPVAANLSPQHQIHHRYVYLITFILRGENSLALTEAANLKRMIKRSETGEAEEYITVIGLFEKYLKALTRNKTEKANTISDLKHKLEAQYRKWDLLASTEIPLRWLMSRLKVIPPAVA